MKPIDHLKLRHNKADNWYHGRVNLLCGQTLREIFDMPKDVINIWATITDKRPKRAGLQSAYVELMVLENNMDLKWRDPDYREDGWIVEYTYLTLDRFLQRRRLTPGIRYFAYLEYE